MMSDSLSEAGRAVDETLTAADIGPELSARVAALRAEMLSIQLILDAAPVMPGGFDVANAPVTFEVARAWHTTFVESLPAETRQKLKADAEARAKNPPKFPIFAPATAEKLRDPAERLADALGGARREIKYYLAANTDGRKWYTGPLAARARRLLKELTKFAKECAASAHPEIFAKIDHVERAASHQAAR